MRFRTPIITMLAAGSLLAGCADADEDPAVDSAVEADDPAEDPADDGGDDGGDDGAGAADDDATADAGGHDMSDADHTVGDPADAADATRTIAVDATDMAFTPDQISVEAGEVVTFEVTNTGEAVHEFFLGDSAMQAEHAEEMAGMAGGMAHDEPWSISLEPGETKQLTWRFPDDGTVEFACHEPGHYEAGMSGQISVG